MNEIEYQEGIDLLSTYFGRIGFDREAMTVQYNHNFRDMDYNVFVQGIEKTRGLYEGKKFPGFATLLKHCKQAKILRDPGEICEKCRGIYVVYYLYKTPYVPSAKYHMTVYPCECVTGEPAPEPGKVFSSGPDRRPMEKGPFRYDSPELEPYK